MPSIVPELVENFLEFSNQDLLTPLIIGTT
jgi:hypothetical protein